MSFTSWRGTVGIVKPTLRPGSLEEFIRLIPEGIGVIPTFLNIREGSESEFKSAIKQIEEKVKELAALNVDIIHPEGAPPFMMLGHKGERDLTERWGKAHGVPILTSGQTQIEAMEALDIQSFVGVTYFTGEINETCATYFREAGFDVLSMEGIEVPFADVGLLSQEQIYAHTKKAFLKHPGAEGIYMLGSGWRVLHITEPLEEDLEVPVVHPVAARAWSIQRHLHVRQPVAGFGQLLEEMP